MLRQSMVSGQLGRIFTLLLAEGDKDYVATAKIDIILQHKWAIWWENALCESR